MRRRHILDCPCLDCLGRVARADARDVGARGVAVATDKHGNPTMVSNGGRWVSERKPRDRNDEGG